jgi:enoyl-CoA hydratase/carnithine racemase
VGRQNAAHLIFTGDTIDAERAYQMGLVQKIAEQSAWNELIKKFNNLSSPVLRLAKKSFRQGLKTPLEKVHGPIINEFFLDQLYEIEDVAEGIKSFGEKRKPEWKHK